MEAIEVSGLTKTYDGRNVVDGLTLTLHEGELFALLGVNGAGKTTTIRMLTGLTAPDGGDARICGHSIRTQLPLVKCAVGRSFSPMWPGKSAFPKPKPTV